MCVVHKVTALLVVVGALNWGLIGLGGMNWNLVNVLLGGVPTVERIVYVLVGLSALMMFTMKMCKPCMAKKEGACGTGKQGDACCGK